MWSHHSNNVLQLKTITWRLASKQTVVRRHRHERNLSRAIGSSKRLARARRSWLALFRVEMEFWRCQCQKFFPMKHEAIAVKGRKERRKEGRTTSMTPSVPSMVYFLPARRSRLFAPRLHFTKSQEEMERPNLIHQSFPTRVGSMFFRPSDSKFQIRHMRRLACNKRDISTTVLTAQAQTAAV